VKHRAEPAVGAGGNAYRSDHVDPEPRFLSVEEVLALHHDLIARFGGDPGLLNPGALEAAVAQPRMTAFGQLIHPGLLAQASAYLFHLVSGHPFCDGNKRIGLFAALVFLRDNGAAVGGTSDDWYELTMAVARGELTKRVVTERLATWVTLGG
jgi:death-on-curing protein